VRMNGLTKLRKSLKLSKLAMAERCGLSPQRYGSMENETRPLFRDGRDRVWLEDAQAIASAVGVPEELLWPQAYRDACRKWRSHAKMTEWSAIPSPNDAYDRVCLNSTIRKLFCTIGVREANAVLQLIMLEQMTHRELSKKWNISHGRIGQIAAKALRKLRHPSRSKRLAEFLPECTKTIFDRAWAEYDNRDDYERMRAKWRRGIW
jgi:transcriptional regulator with XRE-family HTH domain